MRYPGGNLSLVIGGSIVLGVLLFVAFGPLVSGYAVEQMDMRNRLQLPSSEHWLGTDNFGRDLWTRMAVGARVSLAIALSSVAIAVVVGSVVGLISGYFGGWLDLVIMRVVDVFLGFPPIVLALAIVAALGPGVVNLSLSLAAVFWTEYARVVRSVTLAQREADYVTSAVALGASNARILFREILPNVFGPVIVLATLGLGTAIIAESGLSFLGFGVEPPTPTWGGLLSEGRIYIAVSWWIVTFPGLAITITVMATNLVGDWLRNYLDPRFKAR